MTSSEISAERVIRVLDPAGRTNQAVVLTKIGDTTAELRLLNSACTSVAQRGFLCFELYSLLVSKSARTIGDEQLGVRCEPASDRLWVESDKCSLVLFIRRSELRDALTELFHN